MAALMKKAACAPCLSARPSLPMRASRPVRVIVRAQASQEQSFEVGRTVALASAAASMLVAGNANAAVELSQLAANDNRVGIIATLFVPALGWVAYNIFQPFLNQLDRMGESGTTPIVKAKRAFAKRSVAAAVGLSAAALLLADSADAASEIAQLGASDGRVGAIATLFVPALGWVAFNIAQPLFNQLGRMNELADGQTSATSKAVKRAVKSIKKNVNKTK